MSDRIAVMNEGVLQQIGKPSEVYSRPANLFVAGFIGAPSMNLFKGQVSGGRFRHPGLELAASGAPDGEMIAGVRPEDVATGEGPHSAIVRVLEPAGHETLVIMDAGGAPLIARARPEVSLAPGDTIRFGLRHERMHAFDPAGGGRLHVSFNECAQAA